MHTLAGVMRVLGSVNFSRKDRENCEKGPARKDRRLYADDLEAARPEKREVKKICRKG